MRYLRLFVLGTILAISAFLVMSFAPPFLLGMAGFYTTHPGWEVAEILVEKNKDVRGCNKIIRAFWWDVLSPPTAEQRALCVHSYARLTQNPSACELLLPGQYGWSCLGAVKSELGKGWGCGSTSENINCGGHNIYAKNLGISNCDIYKEQILKNWCYEERSATLPGINDCEKISAEPPGWREECQGRYAFKQKDAALCSPISDEKRREVCEMEIRYAPK